MTPVQRRDSALGQPHDGLGGTVGGDRRLHQPPHVFAWHELERTTGQPGTREAGRCLRLSSGASAARAGSAPEIPLPGACPSPPSLLAASAARSGRKPQENVAMARRDGIAFHHSRADTGSVEARLPQHETDTTDSVERHLTVAAYPEAQRARAYQLYQSIQPHVERGVALAWLVGPKASLRALHYRLARYQRGGLAALTRRPRAGKGQRRMPSNERAFIEGLALQTLSRSVRASHRDLREIAVIQSWPTPSYRRRWGCAHLWRLCYALRRAQPHRLP
jgi:hypothetical protein